MDLWITIGFSLAYLGLLVWAAITDYKTREISNWCALGCLALTVGYAVFIALTGTASQIVAHYMLLILWPILFIAFVKGKLGGGDVKIIAPSMVFLNVLWFFVALVVTVIASFIAGNKWKSKIPFATYFAIGAFVALVAKIIFTFVI